MSLVTHLPHRPPFVFVRQLLRCEPGQSADGTACFAADDPMFVGHFPGNPLVPGVILTEALAQVAGIAAASGFTEEERPHFLLSAIRTMKFLVAVRPGEEISLHAEKMAQVGELWQFKVQATVGERKVAEGQLVLNLTPKSSSGALE
ncbi:MAG: 3-hydroxyacyl-ACP dehydratase FabZ family protein [Spartobacteria bacterium]